MPNSGFSDQFLTPEVTTANDTSPAGRILKTDVANKIVPLPPVEPRGEDNDEDMEPPGPPPPLFTADPEAMQDQQDVKMQEEVDFGDATDGTEKSIGTIAPQELRHIMSTNSGKPSVIYSSFLV